MWFGLQKVQGVKPSEKDYHKKENSPIVGEANPGNRHILLANLG